MRTPPLTNLPDPPVLSADAPGLVPAEEILLPSRAPLTRGLWKRSWRIALIMLLLWAFLWLNYVIGTAPTGILLIMPLYMLETSRAASGILAGLGFDTGLLKLSAALVPLLGAATSIALIPVASAVAARSNPQRALGERDFQQQISTRLADVLLAPVVLVAAGQVVVTLSPLRSPWRDLGPGPLAALGLGVLAWLLARTLLRASLPAADLLGVPAAAAIEGLADRADTPPLRYAALARLHAQDRRHLPPAPARLRPTPAGAGRALGVATSSLLPWPAVLIGTLMWVVFGISDAAITFARLGDLTALRTGFGWQTSAVALVMLGLLAAFAALTPFVAAQLHRGKAAQVTDQRTFLHWEQRAAVNPWERAVAGTSGWVLAGGIAVAALAAIVLLTVLGAAHATTIVWCVLSIILIAPIVGASAHARMREELRTVFYGPAGDYMRRSVPWALVAPAHGTRADRDRDPAVQAARRDRAPVGASAALLPGDPPRHRSPHLRESGLLGVGGDGLSVGPDLRGHGQAGMDAVSGAAMAGGASAVDGAAAGVGLGHGAGASSGQAAECGQGVGSGHGAGAGPGGQPHGGFVLPDLGVDTDPARPAPPVLPTHRIPTDEADLTRR